MLRILKNSLIKGLQAIPLSVENSFELREDETLGVELKKLISKNFSRSFHIRYLDSGSCGACESEVIATTNPIYDLQRFGVDFVASPRHADALLVSGPLSKNMALALKKTYDAMPAPKLVITIGDCAIDGGKFKNSYYTLGGVKNILPVAAHIPGCPPKPIAIVRAILKLINDLN